MLKRQRAYLEPDDRRPERACSNSTPLHRGKQEPEFPFEVTPSAKSPRYPSSNVVPRRCIHKNVTAYNLTQASCCAWLDARPDGIYFLRYMDGKAWTNLRWQYYCMSCQGTAKPQVLVYQPDMATEYWGLQANMGRRLRQPLGILKAKKESRDVIRIDYGAGEIDTVRSVDLTLDGLNAEVAQLMRCDPSHLVGCNIAMRSGRVVPGSSNDITLTLCAAHIIFTRVTGGKFEDDAMKDVQYNRA